MNVQVFLRWVYTPFCICVLAIFIFFRHIQSNTDILSYIFDQLKVTEVKSSSQLLQYLNIAKNILSPQSVKYLCAEMIPHPLSVIWQAAVVVATNLIDGEFHDLIDTLINCEVDAGPHQHLICIILDYSTNSMFNILASQMLSFCTSLDANRLLLAMYLCMTHEYGTLTVELVLIL